MVFSWLDRYSERKEMGDSAIEGAVWWWPMVAKFKFPLTFDAGEEHLDVLAFSYY